MWKLAIEDDQGNKTVVNLVRSAYSVGRGDDNTVRLTERNISRKHAKFYQNGGSWVIEDLSSYNGCFVNGVRVAATQHLEHGDLVQVGDYRLVVSDEAVPESEEASATVPTLPKSHSLLDQPDRLVMIAGPTVGTEFPLSGTTLVVGRGEECDIPINHGSVSRVHAEIHALGDGRYEIVDKESANGVRVNAVELKQTLLDARDLIELGDVQLKFIPAGVVYRLADESQRISAIGPDHLTMAPSHGAQGLPLPLKVVGGVLALGLLVLLGMATLGGRSTGASDDVIAAAQVDKATRILDEALALASKGDFEGAHLKVTTELPEDSNARKSQEFRDIEGRWADSILAKAEETQDVGERRRLLSLVAKTPTVDSGRRKLANDKLLEVEADSVEIEDLPEAHPPMAPKPPPAAPKSPKAPPKPKGPPKPKAPPKPKDGHIVRDSPF